MYKQFINLDKNICAGFFPNGDGQVFLHWSNDAFILRCLLMAGSLKIMRHYSILPALPNKEVVESGLTKG